MKLALTGLAGPVLNFANQVQRAFDGLMSPPAIVVETPADLPNATANARRIFIVRSIGGTPGLAFALDGAWRDSTGGVIA